MTSAQRISATYGPVKSWRFGQSLGIDLIGTTSVCSYNCLYCQLGSIEKMTRDRALFVPTAQVVEELAGREWDAVDVVTFSGSGEPTLALNLGDAIAQVKALSSRPVVVLTNGTLLEDLAVQEALMGADHVSVKIDAVSSHLWHRINRPIAGLNLNRILQGMIAFRQSYPGQFSVQTMVMEPWPLCEEQRYAAILKALAPDEVHLNTPLRPRPLHHELEARENHEAAPDGAWRQPRHVTSETLQAMVDRLQADLSMPIHHR